MECFLNIKRFNIDGEFNAGGKAPADVALSFASVGLPEILFIYHDTAVWYKKIPQVFTECLKFLLKKTLKRGDIIHIQDNSGIGTLIALMCKTRGLRIHYHIHDLTNLRFNEVNHQALVLRKSDIIYAHNKCMAQYLVDELNIDGSKLRNIELFDYYSNAPIITRESAFDDMYNIAFAGNLEKSKFLPELFSTHFESVKFHLYGNLGNLKIPENGIFKYFGKFEPSNPSILKAGWGLHWDGDTIKTCAGNLGNYVRYISPHKVSLYLSCGIPVILWRNSALAESLQRQNVALVVDSLEDIPKVLSEITRERYDSMLNSAKEIALRLRKGDYLISKLELNR